MHILFIHQIFLAPDEAGSTRHFELARFLVKSGHKVTIIGSTVSYLTGKVEDRFKGKLFYRENIEGVDIVRAWTYSKIHKSYITRFISFISFMFLSIIAGIKMRAADVVIACSPQIFTGVSGYVVSKIKRIPFIFEIRDLWPRFAVETGVLTNTRLILLAEALEKWIYKRADYFIINSPGFYGHLNNFRVPKEKIFLIPNGVDTEVFKGGEKYNPVRKKLGLDGNFVILYSGAHGLANDLDTVIETARLLKDYTDIVFMLVGDGKEKPKLKKLKEGYGLKNVLFVDAQPKSRMPKFCALADLCLVSLKKVEAFKTVYPNKLFDYMASARPILSTIDGVARDVLDKAGAGVFVEPENSEAMAKAVLSLYRNKKLLEEYGINGRQYALKHFERKKIAEKLNKSLHKVVGDAN